jgi:hypothetical protein
MVDGVFTVFFERNVSAPETASLLAREPTAASIQNEAGAPIRTNHKDERSA